MGYIISVIVSVLIVGTLLRCTNYKVRKRNSIFDYWDNYQFVDMGRYKFPVWVYILSVISSLIFIVNYIFTIFFVCAWMVCRYGKNEYNNGESLEEERFYLDSKIINKLIQFLNKGI